eukprot:3138756-Alexandrium_andersonii.AAC.1
MVRRAGIGTLGNQFGNARVRTPVGPAWADMSEDSSAWAPRSEIENSDQEDGASAPVASEAERATAVGLSPLAEAE